MPEEDSHLSDQTRSQAHPSREFTRAQRATKGWYVVRAEWACTLPVG